jgi:hypothetical protein
MEIRLGGGGGHNSGPQLGWPFVHHVLCSSPVRHGFVNPYNFLNPLNTDFNPSTTGLFVCSGTGRHKLRQRNPMQVFKESKLPDPSKRKGGINWTAYREQYLHPILYPWIREVLQPQLRALTGDDTVWLVEESGQRAITPDSSRGGF